MLMVELCYGTFHSLLPKHSFFSIFCLPHHKATNALLIWLFFSHNYHIPEKHSGEFRLSSLLATLLEQSNIFPKKQLDSISQLLWHNTVCVCVFLVCIYEHLSPCHIPTLIQCTDNHSGIRSFVTWWASPSCPWPDLKIIEKVKTKSVYLNERREEDFPSPHLSLLFPHLRFVTTSKKNPH